VRTNAGDRQAALRKLARPGAAQGNLCRQFVPAARRRGGLGARSGAHNRQGARSKDRQSSKCPVLRADLEVLAWRLSNGMETSFRLEALEDAMVRHGKPEIYNSLGEDRGQGSPCISAAFTGKLIAGSIRVSMDGRGTCRQIFCWRSPHQHSRSRGIESPSRTRRREDRQRRGSQGGAALAQRAEADAGCACVLADGGAERSQSFGERLQG
jgi:hypothetical protein